MFYSSRMSRLWERTMPLDHSDTWTIAFLRNLARSPIVQPSRHPSDSVLLFGIAEGERKAGKLGTKETTNYKSREQT